MVGCAGDEPLVAIPEPYEAVAKGMSVSEEVAMAGDPAGSQAQSGESGSLPNQVSLPGGQPLDCLRLCCALSMAATSQCKHSGLGLQQGMAPVAFSVLRLQCCGRSMQRRGPET